jgi:hypothetical protein
MRDDLPRLLAPPLLPNGLPNPAHMEKLVYLARARAAAAGTARANGVDPARVRVGFPDSVSFAPLQARTEVVARLDGAGETRVEASATAEAAAPPLPGGGAPAIASGGGYAGPLLYRDGEGMRPDVAAAFDRMAAAARTAGLSLLVVSGFRSDAEQAALFAAHPDPMWVAPPGHSLHRCATELDLGPESAYGWLAANAGRFGFLERYSWVSLPVSIGRLSCRDHPRDCGFLSDHRHGLRSRHCSRHRRLCSHIGPVIRACPYATRARQSLPLSGGPPNVRPSSLLGEVWEKIFAFSRNQLLTGVCRQYPPRLKPGQRVAYAGLYGPLRPESDSRVHRAWGDAVIVTSLYVLGPVAALLVAVVVYVIERVPIIGARWIDFLDKLEDYRERRRQRRERR